MQILSQSFNNTYQSSIPPQSMQVGSSKATQVNIAYGSQEPMVSKGEQVSISTQAQQMLANETRSGDVGVLPAAPVTTPVIDIDNYIALMKTQLEIQKTQAQYEVASDLINIATGNSDGISSATAYTLKNNDEVRASTVNQMALNNQAALIEQYAAVSMATAEEY